MPALTPRRIFAAVAIVLLALICWVVVANVLLRPTKSNAALLRELIDSHFFERAASEKVAKFRQSPSAGKSTPDEWARYEQELRQCMVHEATAYLASQDPYLRERSDWGTENDMTRRFLGQCRVVE